MAKNSKSDFEEVESEVGLLGEFVGFLFENKKFWMIPILLSLLVIGSLIVFSQTAAGLLIYPFF